MAQQTIDIGSAPNDHTGDPIRDSFDKCNDNFTELYGSLAGLLDFQGATDCSANPNYPAASQGDIYIVSVAGKVGGASGKDVEVGDFYLALADNAGGDEATVGTSWAVLQANITGGIGSGVDVEDEGVAEATAATTLNFVGAGVTAADVGGGVVDITIPGSSGGIDVEDEGVAEATAATVLNFTGAGVTATDVGGGTVDIDIPGGGGSFRGALVKKSVDQTGANYTTITAIAWTAEEYDTDTIHDNSTDNTRLTVPSGVTRVRLSAQLSITSVGTGNRATSDIHKNGAAFFGGASVQQENVSSVRRINLTTAVVTVTSGDYFECKLAVVTDTSVDLIATDNWFSMEIIE